MPDKNKETMLVIRPRESKIAHNENRRALGTSLGMGLETSLGCLFLQVTGGNRGLGFAIVKKLCQTFQGVVILTGKC